MVMKRGNSTHDLVTAATMPLTITDGRAPRRVMLLPIGEIKLRDGRGPYRIRDRAHAEQVVAATRLYLGTVDFNFDYGHGQQDDQAAIAAGWAPTVKLTVEDDGIYADEIDWTPAGAQRIVDKEYRYISPYFFADKPAKGGDVLALVNAGLVNIPAINMPAIAAGASKEMDDMDLTAIAAALGLPATATAEEVAAAAANIKAKADTVAATSQIALAAGLAADAGIEAIAASVATIKAKADKPDLTGYVPAAVVEPMREQLKTLNGERLGKKVDDLVAAGIVMPSKRQSTLDWFEKDEVAASAFFADMPAIVEPGASLGHRKPTEKATSLSVDEVAACTALGVSQDEFLAIKNEGIA